MKRFLGPVLGLMLVGSALAASPAHALPTHVFTVTNANDAGTGSLRQAIADANLNGNMFPMNSINFAIAPPGLHTIVMSTVPLPAVTVPVTIDGYTQPGSAKNSLAYGSDAVVDIGIDGSALTGSDLLAFDTGSAGSIVRGLEIKSTPLNAAIRFFSGTDTGYSIEGCFLGTDAAGTAAAGNGIGVKASSGHGITIGGANPGQRNIIAGNTVRGIELSGPSDQNRILGNLIGLDRSGSPLPNGGDAIKLTGGSVGNKILDNAISSSAPGLGIDLDDDGVTPNDRKDPDTGTNNLQNFPKLAFATINTDGSTTISGRLNSRPKRLFIIQFFANANSDDPDGEIPLGQLNVRTNRKGNATFKFTTTEPVVASQTVTATATNFSTGDTSEFSAPVTAAVG